jgi:hypothetical protein
LGEASDPTNRPFSALIRNPSPRFLDRDLPRCFRGEYTGVRKRRDEPIIYSSHGNKPGIIPGQTSPSEKIWTH